ncbi:MAG: diaminobutyrate acetyltransferase [Gammaproteobacteria bacterium]
MSLSQPQTVLRPPTPNDGASVFRLIGRCPPLDTNSMYCNLLQCTHFAGTSVAAVQTVNTNEELVGFISAYLIPEREDTLFIWQVAVDERARGIGLAGNMLKHILDRPQCNQITYLETTITESNKASWALFESLANKLGTTLEKSVMFDRDKHLAGEHDTELLARIGPFKFAQT